MGAAWTRANSGLWPKGRGAGCSAHPTIRGYRLCHSGTIIVGVVAPYLGDTSMSDVTRILSAIEQGDPSAAEQLLPLVYDELRKLAAAKMAQEPPGQTLQATALVHEAYIRLVDVEKAQHWDGRRHFFAAAAEAMRRILVERARRKEAERHGGGRIEVALDDSLAVVDQRADELLAIDEALEALAHHDPEAAELVKLRFFAGLGHQEAAAAMGIGRRKADRLWALARAWMYRKVSEKSAEGPFL
jgi:RNA polymerase sigma factor (TIGR02999 family)